MPKQPCLHCGLPTWVPSPEPEPVKPVFCCTGCALAHRLTNRSTDGANAVEAQQVSPLQMVAWLTGFAAFNQGVFWILHGLLRDEGREALSRAAGYASMGLGVLVWLVVVVGLATCRRPGVADGLVWALTAAGIVLALITYSLSCAMVATLGLAVWSLRGFFRRKTAR